MPDRKHAEITKNCGKRIMACPFWPPIITSLTSQWAQSNRGEERQRSDVGSGRAEERHRSSRGATEAGQRSGKGKGVTEERRMNSRGAAKEQQRGGTGAAEEWHRSDRGGVPCSPMDPLGPYLWACFSTMLVARFATALQAIFRTTRTRPV